LVWKRWTHNLGAKVLALVASTALWYFSTSQLPTTIVRDVPVRYDLPPDITPVTELPATVKAEISGQGRFLSYRMRDTKCVLDLTGKAAGPDVVDFSRAQLILPAKSGTNEWEITEPKEMEVEFDEKTTRNIPVSPVVVGTPDPRFVQVGKTFVHPAEARVTGPRKIVDDIPPIATEAIDITGDRNTLRKRVRLVPPAPPPVEVAPHSVEVGITIEPRIDRKIPEIALTAAALPAGLRADFRPPVVELELSGARSVVEVAAEEVTSLALHAGEWLPGTTVLRLAEVRGPELVFHRAAAFPLGAAAAESGAAAPADSGAPGEDREEVTARLPLPPGIEILGVTPRSIAVSIASADVGPELTDGGREETGELSP